MKDSCPKCDLPPTLGRRSRLLGADIVYVEDKSCPRCGFVSEETRRDRNLRVNLWAVLFADESLPMEQRLEEGRRREIQKEGLRRLLRDDDRYVTPLDPRFPNGDR